MTIGEILIRTTVFIVGTVIGCYFANKTIDWLERRRAKRERGWECWACNDANYEDETTCFYCGAPKETQPLTKRGRQ
jgi:hypothetical protein